jgi:hypothetical protein
MKIAWWKGGSHGPITYHHLSYLSLILLFTCQIQAAVAATAIAAAVATATSIVVECTCPILDILDKKGEMGKPN